MSITSIYDKDHKDQKTVDFPWLGIAEDGDVVLFTGKRNGTLVRHGGESNLEVGMHSASWNMSIFKPLPEGEKLVLQNNWELGNAE